MATIREDTGLSFDDVLLVPRKSTINSRFDGEIDLSVELVPNVKLEFPLVSANMDTITETDMSNEMYRLGGLGIVHRFLPAGLHYDMLTKIMGARILCVGVGEKEFERFSYFWERRNTINIQAVLVDVAHGYSTVMFEQIDRIKRLAPNFPIIAGNVACYNGALDLLTAGIHSIKCGVGPGSVCSTRIQTGNGVPQLTAIMECRRAIDDFCNGKNLSFVPTLIADGGVRAGGDVVKSLAGGANAVMIGNLFAATEEATGELVRTKTGIVKKYRGLASRDAQENWKGFATSIEGEMTFISYKGPVKNVFNELITGVLSGMSYQDAHNLKELQENAVFIRQTSAGYRESQPHALLKE